MSLSLSAIQIEISEPQFVGALIAYGDDEAFHSLQSDEDLFVYRHRGRKDDSEVLLIRLAGDRAVPGATFTRLDVQDHLYGIARLIEGRLVALLPRFELQRTRWGVQRIRTQDDLVDNAFSQIKRRRPPQLAGIHKFHRTAFRVRCEHVGGRAATLMLTVEFRRHHEIVPTVGELLERGLRLDGLDVFTREQESDKKTWLGHVVGRNGDGLVLSDGTAESTIDGRSHYLEPSTEAFTALFEQALGADLYADLQRAEWRARAAEVSGTGYVRRLNTVGEHLRKAGRLAVAPTIEIEFGGVVGVPMSSRSRAATQLPDVEYCFSWDRTAIDKYPARGLDKFGPFDGSVFDKKEPRLLVVCPAGARDDVDHFVRRLRDGTAADNQSRFARGFVGTYRLNRLRTRFAGVQLGSSEPHAGRRYVDVLREELGGEQQPDVVLVVVRDEDAFNDHDNPYLAAKAFLLAQGIPSQEIRLSVLQTRASGLPYVLENIAVATYAKLGGSPWTIRPTMPLTKEVVIGMAHAQFGGRYSPLRRFMGITTVFSSDGSYLLAAGSPRCEYEKYAETLATSVRETLTRLAADQGWTAGDVVRLVFHAPKPLTGQETDMIAKTAAQSLGAGIQFESAFLTIETEHPFKVIEPAARGRDVFVEKIDGSRGMARVGECAPPRGLVIDLGRAKRLLCVTGSLLMKREGESIPQPLQVTLHRRSTYTDLTALTRQVFHFTGLSWRSMLPVAEPVTLLYPHLIASLLGRLDGHPSWSDELLDTRLRRSRWFL